jgi:REase_AHJR-like
MDFEKELESVAKDYRKEGYAVVTHPGSDQLPGFAKEFGADILATRGDENVLVQVKRNRVELEYDPTVLRLAEITKEHPGWRYDLVILEGGSPESRPGYKEPSTQQIEEILTDAERVTSVSPRAAFVLAWAGLEASMRRIAQRAGIGGRLGTQPLTLIRELYTSGRISPKVFRELEELRIKRTELVHGMEAPPVDAGWVRLLVDTARQFLAESDKMQAVAG